MGAWCAKQKEKASTLLNVQDTTELNLTHLHGTKGLGTLGNPLCRGLFIHSAIVVTPDGVGIGLLDAITWARPPEELGKAKTRKERPWEEKESYRWWEVIQRSEERAACPGLLLHVSDRESDIYDLFEAAAKAMYRLLVRAKSDRSGFTEEKIRFDSLWETAATWLPLPQSRKIHLAARPPKDGHPALAARSATVELRYKRVYVEAPGERKGGVWMTALLVQEVETPDGVEAVEWRLLTTDEISSDDAAWQYADWYVYRWVIEEYHKCLKTGCKAEKRQFEERDHYEVALAIMLLASCRLVMMTKLARTQPTLPAATVLAPEEEEVLLAHAASKGVAPQTPMTVELAVRWIARLGGYLDRKSDGPPGWLTLWRGFLRLQAMVEGYRLARASPSLEKAPKRSG